MQIRFLTTIPTEHGAFHCGQVIDVAEPTPQMLAWLEVLPDGTRRAEVVREAAVEDVELATVAMPERAVVKRGKRSA
jgi:hypothetical protein